MIKPRSSPDMSAQSASIGSVPDRALIGRESHWTHLTNSAESGLPPASFIERTACALCGSSKREVHRAFRDIPVVRCSQCGFLYSSRTMNSDLMHHYYRENFGSERHLRGQMVNARTNATVLTELLQLSQIRSWLDVGTGYGFLLQWLHNKHSIAADGVELSVQEAEYAKHKLGLPVHCNLLSESGVRRGHYDVVSSFEVIEHISDPTSFLAEMAEYVRPGGQLVVMTDNFESRPVRQLRGGFPKWIPHTHVSHFSAQSLRRCIAGVAGLTIEREASYTPWDLVAREWLSTVRGPVPDELAYDLRSALSTEMHRNYKFFQLRYSLNSTWTRFHLRGNLEHGELMYAVCRKQG
jgi:2-polyprenyl-3-methyl-5-hydroxy-6-metoxy-1,4-benzoquinol methylase